jgi:hypothetical protein
MATTTNYSWTTPDDTALVKDGAAAIRSLGTAIDTTTYNNAQAAIAKTLIDAKGDLIAGSAADTVARLAVGANNTILVADSTTATGLKWAAPAGGGKVLQVITAQDTTSTTVASTTYGDTGLTATITPTSATSKILVLATMNIYVYQGANDPIGNVRLMRDSTVIMNDIATGTNGTFASYGIAALEVNGITWTILDSPATTSAIIYKTQMAVKTTASSSQIVTNNRTGARNSITLLEIGA